MSIDFQTAVPNELITQQPVSTAKTILRKQQLEFYPQDQNTFSPTGNNQMVFKIGSNSDFINLKKSYFEFKLNTTNKNVSLSSGGVHSLFRTASVRMLSTGNLIQKIDNYNKYAALYLKKQSPEMSTMNGLSSGDYAQSGAADQGHEIYGPPRVYDLLNTSFGNITSADVNATHQGVVYSVTEVTDDDIGTFSFNSADIPFGSLVETYGEGRFMSFGRSATGKLLMYPPVGNGFVLLSKNLRVSPYVGISSNPSHIAKSADSLKLIFKPILSIFDLDIPLFLLKGGGLEFRFELDDADRCMMLSGKPTVTDLSYTLDNPRFVGMMITPHQDIVREFMQQWASPEGLLYAIPGVVTRKSTSEAGDEGSTLQVHPGVRSARRIWTIQQDSTLHNSTGSHGSRISDHMGISVRGSMIEWQYRVGSHEFPRNRVDIDSGSGGGADGDSYDQFSRSWKQLWAVNGGRHSFSYAEWTDCSDIQCGWGSASKTHESRYFVPCADLSRDDGMHGNLSGTDVSVIPLDFIYKRSYPYNTTSIGTLPGTPTWYHFIEHDEYFMLSEAQTAVLN